MPSIRLPAPTIWLKWSNRAAAEGTGFAPPREDGILAVIDGPSVMIGAFLSSVAGSPKRFTVNLIVLRDVMRDWKGEITYGFVPLPFGFVCDTESPLPPEAFADEIALAGRICTSTNVLSNKLLGPAMIGSLAAMTAGDPEFFDARPDAGGYQEHRFLYDREGQLMLSEAAMERLDIHARSSTLALPQRAASARMQVTASPITGARLGARSRGSVAPKASDILANIAVFTNMYSSTFGFLVAVLAMMANPKIVDGSDTQRAGNRRSVGARSLPYLGSRVLKLRLKRKAAVTAAVRSAVHRQAPRLHDVDGHWRTSHRRGSAGLWSVAPGSAGAAPGTRHDAYPDTGRDPRRRATAPAAPRDPAGPACPGAARRHPPEPPRQRHDRAGRD